ncbi:MAG: hypothetical protein FWD54_05370 [Endomicrobia bacterium]|nr:hypothetical protein [Endomicrobiia bacterium]MCL2799682.1 hypothetical protein [Endomicrobiia bacterium]
MLYLFKISFLSLKNKISSLKFSEDLKAAFFIFIGINLVLIIYAASYSLLKYVNSVAVAGPLLVNKITSLFFLAAFMMTALSSVIVSFSSIYFGKDLKLLLSLPLKTGDIFSFKVLNAFFYASWMVLAGLMPFLIAFAVVKGAGIWFYVCSLVFAVPFLASASFTGTAFSVVIMKFFPKAKIRNIIFVTGAVFFTALIVVLRLTYSEKLISTEGFALLSQYLSYLDSPTAKFLPSWWYAGAIFGLAAENLGKVLFYFFMLSVGAAFMWAGLKFLAKKYFVDGLDEGQAFAPSRIKKENYGVSSAFSSLLKKDMKVFFRDSGQWSQVLIIASIVLVYLFSMYKLSFETIKMHNTMSLVNCALVWFVATAVALRLSFPLISLEGDSFWFLFTIPVKKFKIFTEKILFGSFSVCVVSIVLIAVTNYMMSISYPVFLITVSATVFVTALIACASVSIGAILPKFNYSSIPQIESSLGGLIFMLFSFFVIIVNILILMQPVRLFYAGSYSQILFVKYFIFIVLVNLCFLAVIFSIGYNAFKRIEK